MEQARMRTFTATDISYKALMQTGAECTFGNFGPTELRVNEDMWRRLMHFMVDLADPRLPLVIGFICSTARIVFDPDIPDNTIDFYVPYDNEKYGARLELRP